MYFGYSKFEEYPYVTRRGLRPTRERVSDILLGGLITGGFIDGAETNLHSNRTLETINPSTGEMVAEIGVGDEQDIETATLAAESALRTWQKTVPSTRGRILMAIAQRLRTERDSFSRVESTDTGKPLTLALGDVEIAARYFEFYAGAADKVGGAVIPLGPEYHAYTSYEPFGVVGIILPWNAPLQQAARSIAPALAAGNTVVVKPAEDAPLSCSLLAKLAVDCGLPAGVLNVVPGDGPTTGAALLVDPRVQRIMFTGSVDVGKIVARAGAERLVEVGLELGGKSPNIVFDDADLASAAAGACLAITYNAGQACSAGSRLYVQRSVYESFLELVIDRLQGLKVGHALEDPDIGPIATREQFARINDYLTKAPGEGAKPLLEVRPEVLDRYPRGQYVGPCVFEAPPDASIVREEVFGPVLVAAPFDDVDESIALANSTEYGLVSGVWTRDINRAHYVASQMQSGQVFVNNWFGGGVETPFGGYKHSGVGREKGLEGLRHYSQVKTTIIKLGSTVD